MDAGNWAGIIVAVIALVSALLSGRAAASASKYSTKAQAETEAYNRARKMDIETIERQDTELAEIREENKKMDSRIRELKIDNERLHEDNDRLRRRITHLENLLGETNEHPAAGE